MIVAFVSSCTAVMISRIDSVDATDRSASFRTSAATTANPLPASPARAASIAAFSARMFVCAAMSLISPKISPIFCARSPSDSDCAAIVSTFSRISTIVRTVRCAASATAFEFSAIDPAVAASSWIVADVSVTAADCSLVAAAALRAASRSSPATSLSTPEVVRSRASSPSRSASRSDSRPSVSLSSASRSDRRASVSLSSASRRADRPTMRTTATQNPAPGGHREDGRDNADHQGLLPGRISRSLRIRRDLSLRRLHHVQWPQHARGGRLQLGHRAQLSRRGRPGRRAQAGENGVEVPLAGRHLVQGRLLASCVSARMSASCARNSSSRHADRLPDRGRRSEQVLGRRTLLVLEVDLQLIVRIPGHGDRAERDLAAGASRLIPPDRAPDGSRDDGHDRDAGRGQLAGRPAQEPVAHVRYPVPRGLLADLYPSTPVRIQLITLRGCSSVSTPPPRVFHADRVPGRLTGGMNRQ